MDKSTKFLTMVYELLDELIGGIIPGMYFCTYFLICAFITFRPQINEIATLNDNFICFFFLAISYVLGTLFKRGNMELTDKRSVQYILKNAKTEIKDSEYMLNLEDNYCSKKLLNRINKLKEEYGFHISTQYIESKKEYGKLTLVLNIRFGDMYEEKF